PRGVSIMSAGQNRERFLNSIDQLYALIGFDAPFDPDAIAKLTGEIMALAPLLGIEVEYARLSTAWGPLPVGEAQTRIAQWRAYLGVLRATAQAKGPTLDPDEHATRKASIVQAERNRREEAEEGARISEEAYRRHRELRERIASAFDAVLQWPRERKGEK